MRICASVCDKVYTLYRSKYTNVRLSPFMCLWVFSRIYIKAFWSCLLTRASCSHIVALWRLCCVLIHLMSVNLWKLFETVSSNSERALSLFLDTHYVAETDMINIKSSCYRKIWRLWSIPKYCTLLSRIISKILMVHNICRDRGFAPFTVGTRIK